MTPHQKSKLASWVEHGFISAEQAERILMHERGAERPWVLYGIVGIGVTALVTGVVSLVAANWEDISGAVKLGCFFALQAGVGYGFHRKAAQPGLAREAWLALFVPLLLAGIGLLAQLYNLHGDGWQALLLWAVISTPIVVLAQSFAVIQLWAAALFTSGVIWAAADLTAVPRLGRACIVASLPLLFIACGFASEHMRRFNDYLRKTLVVWGMGAVLLVGTPLANALWGDAWSEVRQDMGWLAVPWTALGVACAAIWFRPGALRALRGSMIGLLVSAGVALTLPLFQDDYANSLEVDLMGAFGFFVTWVLAATAAAHSKHRRWFDFASFVIAVRIVVVYFEVFGSLAMTGVGLIISGAVTLGIAFAWHHFRARVRQQLGGEA